MSRIIELAERIVYRAKLKFLEEAALAGIADAEGLALAPLCPPSRVIQVVSYHGLHLGRVRQEREGGWIAVAKGAAHSSGPYEDARAAAESLYVQWILTPPHEISRED
ncbi:hypothetical protein [Streptomyces sp. NRRL F-2747]|uniref:hypothetical protein n=1 Tax=Streptomyces sp. NRRL F-2747 TaxID=1463843 RepID=UPI00131EB621|nr:hypothetical protein [Streptomyces sp. NRRL F-2747]